MKSEKNIEYSWSSQWKSHSQWFRNISELSFKKLALLLDEMQSVYKLNLTEAKRSDGKLKAKWILGLCAQF